mmetsp:Transcript_8218/g.13578  ORF Transcript_8218/g.13578 Transcript_8218/m.13578 type:complete len:230 (+) Transcript_8218:965-1654(+)
MLGKEWMLSYNIIPLPMLNHLAKWWWRRIIISISLFCFILIILGWWNPLKTSSPQPLLWLHLQKLANQIPSIIITHTHTPSKHPPLNLQKCHVRTSRLKRQHTRIHLIHHNTQRPQIGSNITPTPALIKFPHRLWRHKVRSPHKLWPIQISLNQILGGTKINQYDMSIPLTQQDILRFDISMDNPMPMAMFYRRQQFVHVNTDQTGVHSHHPLGFIITYLTPQISILLM